MSVSRNLEEPQVAPHLRVELQGADQVSHTAEVRRGDQVLWVNVLNKACTISFEQRSPFSDQGTKHTIASQNYKLSPPIDGQDGEYPYKVECGDDDDDDKGDPVIVIKG